MKRRILDLAEFLAYFFLSTPIFLLKLATGTFDLAWFLPISMLYIPVSLYLFRGISTSRFLPNVFSRSCNPLKDWQQIKDTQAVFPAVILFLFLSSLTILLSPGNSTFLEGRAISTSSLDGIILGYSMIETGVLILVGLLLAYQFLECRTLSANRIDKEPWSGVYPIISLISAISATTLLAIAAMPRALAREGGNPFELLIANGVFDANIIEGIAFSIFGAALSTTFLKLVFPSLRLATAIPVQLNACAIWASVQESVVLLHRRPETDALTLGLTRQAVISASILALAFFIYAALNLKKTSQARTAYPPVTFAASPIKNGLAFLLLSTSMIGLLLVEGVNLLLTGLIFALVVILYVAGARNRTVMNRKITEQTWLLPQKSEENEKLILNILPASVAEDLKRGRTNTTERFESASIIFADIVGFTEFSERLSPEGLVSMLDSLFSRIDASCDRFGVEKIKTIGDCYMAVAGLPVRDPGHADSALKFAKGLLEDVAEFNRANDAKIAMRVGINSGRVVAGVIGKHKFIYDLWGDAVNIASRMESSGVGGRIQVSKATLDLLTEKPGFETRENIEIKGKGRMTTFLVLCGD